MKHSLPLWTDKARDILLACALQLEVERCRKALQRSSLSQDTKLWRWNEIVNAFSEALWAYGGPSPLQGVDGRLEMSDVQIGNTCSCSMLGCAFTSPKRFASALVSWLRESGAVPGKKRKADLTAVIKLLWFGDLAKLMSKAEFKCEGAKFDSTNSWNERLGSQRGKEMHATVGELLLLADAIRGVSQATLAKRYGLKTAEEMVGKPKSVFEVEKRKMFDNEALKLKDEQWRLMEKLEAERKKAIESAYKKFDEETALMKARFDDELKKLCEKFGVDMLRCSLSEIRWIL